MQRIHVTIRPLNREDSVLYFPPEAFGPFRVLHQIGAGTLGPVFRAYEPSRDRLVAVKVFRLDLTPEQAAALVSGLEALVAANINHPNIAAPIAAGLEHGAAYLAQEYAVGDSLDVVLRERGPLPVGEVVALVESLAGAIDAAADRGVHHGLLHMRDIVLSDDAVRITGLGISAALSAIGAKLPTRPQYSCSDTSSDVYSLGAIAFEAVAGKRVSADNLTEFEAQHGHDLRAAFDAPLAAQAEQRPKRAGDFAAALAGAIGAIGAGGAMGAKSAPLAPAPVAPIAPDTDFDLRVDEPIDLMTLPDEPIDRFIEPSSPPMSISWAAQPPPALATEVAIDPEPSRRWPIVAIFLGFAVIAALSVGYLLRSPTPTPLADSEPGVNGTVVDLPASAPTPPSATAGKPTASAAAPADRAELRRDTPAPAPSPSRPASGAVRGAQTGSVLIRSTPADADVLVNGKPRGKTPLALRELPLGSYTILVARDGYAAEERTLQLTARRPTTSTTINLRTTPVPPDVTAEKTGPGGINVQSRPAGARVFVNNQLAGSTPIAIPDLPAGPATVRIEMDGYQPWTTTVRVGAGELMKVAASLERK